MSPIGWLIVGVTGWGLAIGLHRRWVRRLDGSGDPEHGIIVFVEPVRWLFYIWGFACVVRGLRRAGCGQHIRLFRWSGRAGALLVLPDLMRRGRLLVKAARLARFLDSLADQHPGRTIHLIGYSTGCFITLQALRHVRRREAIGTVSLLAGTISPGFALDPLAGAARSIHNFHSLGDFLINGLAPLLFGCNDRRWAPACGMIGFSAPSPHLHQRGWSLRDLRHGYLGDHFTIVAPAFIARHIAPVILRPLPDREALP